MILPNPEISAYARVKTGKAACFSSSQTVLEFIFEATDDVRLIVSQNPAPKNFSVERAVAEEFLSKIFTIIAKPEILSEWRCTIFYSSDVEWRNLSFTGGAQTGKISCFSNEFTTEQFEEIAAGIEGEKMKEKAGAVLAKGVHRHALEIHSAVKDFAKKYLK